MENFPTKQREQKSAGREHSFVLFLVRRARELSSMWSSSAGSVPHQLL
jgi:hypothetical protein